MSPNDKSWGVVSSCEHTILSQNCVILGLLFNPEDWNEEKGFRVRERSGERLLVTVAVEKKPRVTHVARVLRSHHHKSQTFRPSSTFHHFGSRFKPPHRRKMNPDRTHDGSDLSPEPTVTSVLGLSGPIRFRLHGSTQKAHLLLKQFEEKRPLDGTSGTHGVAYYSLFAQKRIEVKPGKEILLALEGKFGDRPILICGDIPSLGHEPMKASPSTTTVETVATKVEPAKPSRTASPMPVREATPNLPPKLRKAWMKSIQNRQPVERAFLLALVASVVEQSHQLPNLRHERWASRLRWSTPLRALTPFDPSMRPLPSVLQYWSILIPTSGQHLSPSLCRLLLPRKNLPPPIRPQSWNYPNCPYLSFPRCRLL